MHEGRLHRTGTPAELRESLGLQRLEVRAADLRRAATALAQRDGHRRRPALRRPARRDGAPTSAMGERAVRDGAGRRRPRVSTRCGPPPRRSRTRSSPSCASLEGDAARPAVSRPATRHAGGPTAVAIGARGLRKTFGDFVAVKGIDLEVRYGEVYGLLGANGAGKTTTIKMLCGLVEPSEGDVQLAGERGTPALRRPCGSRSATCRRSSRSTTTSPSRRTSTSSPASIGCRRSGAPARKRWVLEFAGLDGQGRSAHREPAGRVEAARGVRGGDHARAARALPRRADVRRRSDRAPRLLGHDQPARRPGHRDPGHHALSGRGRAVQPAGIHGRRRAGGRGHAERREGGAGRPRARDPRRRPAARRRRCSRRRWSRGACRSSAIALHVIVDGDAPAAARQLDGPAGPRGRSGSSRRRSRTTRWRTSSSSSPSEAPVAA